MVLLLGLVAFPLVFRLSPEEALSRFHAQTDDGETAEDQLMCPLVRAGADACDAIAREVTNREMPLRRYAIGAIGALRCRRALPTLTSMIQAEDERDFVRGDALEAVWMIDRPSAESFAKALAGRSDYLGSTAARVLRGEVSPPMTYWDAVVCLHH
jgi:hypothetical protein